MKSIAFAFVGCVSSLWAVSPLFAQQAPEFPRPTEEHQWLTKFAGSWETKTEGSPGPNQPPITCEGTIAARPIGGFWVVLEYETKINDDHMSAVQTIGYDTQKKQYVGTWIDSMTGHLWQYSGDVNEDGKTLALEAAGPNMMDPSAQVKYRDFYEFKTNDLIAMTSQMQAPDGEWVTFMTGTAKRKP